MSYGSIDGDFVKKVVFENEIFVASDPAKASAALDALKKEVSKERTLNLYGVSTPNAVIIDPPPPGVYFPIWRKSVQDRGLGIMVVPNPDPGMPAYFVATNDASLAGKLTKAANAVVMVEPSGGWVKGGSLALWAAGLVGVGFVAFVLYEYVKGES